MKFVEVTVTDGNISGKEWLARAEPVHRQLRPSLPPDYAAKMAGVLVGSRMALATDEVAVRGLALYRCYENTSDGVKFYVDDLVTDANYRSLGVGHALIAYLEGIARNCGASGLSLDSGTHRTQAHKFYFREGFVITSFNFMKSFL